MIAIHQTGPNLAQRAPYTNITVDAALFNDQKLLHYLLDAVPDTFLILNEYRQVVFANEAFQLLLGLKPETQILGQSPGELLGCTHAESATDGCGTADACTTCGAFKAIQRALQGQQRTEECRISLANGEALDLRVSANPLRLEGRDYCSFAIIDISDQKRRVALEHTFFHDVLNTAGVIASYTEMLETHPDNARAMVNELHVTALRLIEEISSHKELVYAENGELCPEGALIYVEDFVEELTQQYAHYFSIYNRKVRLVTPGDIQAAMETDDGLLGRVLGNMIKNALEASPDCSTVTVSYQIKDDHVIFSVHNETYIPRRVQLQIFNRSFSTKGAGRGLGTYSMKLLSERYLHGSVSFESDKEAGTTFYAKFPLRWPS